MFNELIGIVAIFWATSAIVTALWTGVRRRSKRAVGLRGLLAVTTTALVLQLHAGASIAATPTRTFYPVHQPVQLDLPDRWIASPPPQGTAFVAYDPESSEDISITANVNIAVSPFPHSNFKHFASVAIAAIREQHLTRDPRAIDHWRRVVLPAGPAVEVVELLRLSVGSKRVLYAGIGYSFLHGGRSYNFDYIVPAAKHDEYFPVFRRSARTIRFTPR